MTIILHQHMDSEKISELLTESLKLSVDVKCDYTDLKAASDELDLSLFDTEEMAALNLVLDKSTWLYESGCYVFVIRKKEKIFSLENSFVRDSEVTTGSKTAIPDGSVLNLRFEIPGFSENNFREIPLYFNADFNPADLELLQEIGINLLGNGSEFTFENLTDCKISFSKPEIVGEEYIIDFSEYNEIINQ